MAESLNERYSRLMRGPACAGKSSRHSFNTRMRRMGYSDSEIATASVLRERGNIDVMDSRLLCQPLVDWVEKFWDFDNLDITEGKDFSVMHRPTKAYGVDKPSVDLLEHLRGDGSDPQRGRSLNATPSGGPELVDNEALAIDVQGDDVVVSRKPKSTITPIGKVSYLGFRVAQPTQPSIRGVAEGKEAENRFFGVLDPELNVYKCLPPRSSAVDLARLGNPLAAGLKDKGFVYDYLIALSERDFAGIPECGVTHPNAGQLGQALINMIKGGFVYFEGELLLTLAQSDVLASKH